MKNVAAVIDGRAVTGTPREVVDELYPCWWLSLKDSRQLQFRFLTRKQETGPNYSEEYTHQEMLEEAAKFLFYRLPQYGVELYTKTGFPPFV